MFEIEIAYVSNLANPWLVLVGYSMGTMKVN
jgi:hypothetical protein